jgi:hypothetical protein
MKHDPFESARYHRVREFLADRGIGTVLSVREEIIPPTMALTYLHEHYTPAAQYEALRTLINYLMAAEITLSRRTRKDRGLPLDDDQFKAQLVAYILSEFSELVSIR